MEKNLTVKLMIEQIGRAALVERGENITQQAVSRALKDELIPASWYPVVRDMCREISIECPDKFFRFDGVRKGRT